MTECGLIGKYGGYYYRTDLERIRAVLQYEQMREKQAGTGRFGSEGVRFNQYPGTGGNYVLPATSQICCPVLTRR